MKRLLILAAVCLMGIFSSCQKQNQDYSVSLSGTKWEATNSYQNGNQNVTDKYLMELKTESTGVLTYTPEKGNQEVVNITYEYEFPTFVLRAKRDGETVTRVQNGTVSDDYKVITFKGLTFNRK